MLTLGVDAARGGWIAVALQDGRFATAALERRLPALLERFEEADIVGVDIPIGLPAAGTRRRADLEARRIVGPRRASVFFTPSRVAIEAQTYSAVRELEPSTSAQAWALRTAILDVNRIADARVREVHPEVSFAVLAARPLAFAKRTWNGQQERLRLLDGAGIRIPHRLDAGLVPPDDVIDAAVAAWSATRIARGEHLTVPADPLPQEPVIHT